MPQLLKVKEVAVQLGIGYQAVLDLIHAGELPVVPILGRVEREDRKRIGPPEMKTRRSYRVDAADVEALILKWKASKEAGPNSGPMAPKLANQTHENTRAQSRARSGEFIVKPLWYKQFENSK